MNYYNNLLKMKEKLSKSASRASGKICEINYLVFVNYLLFIIFFLDFDFLFLEHMRHLTGSETWGRMGNPT